MNFKKYLWVLICITAMTTCSHEKKSRVTLKSPKTFFTKKEVDSITQCKIDSAQNKHYDLQAKYLNQIKGLVTKAYYDSESGQAQHKKGAKIQMFRKLNFDQGQWRMVFRYVHPHLFLKYGQIMSKEELKHRLKQANFHKHNDMKTAWFPYRELKDVAIMKQMQKEFIFEYKGGFIGTPGYVLLVFQDGKLRFETYVVFGPEAFQGRDGYCRSPKEGLVVDYLAKFKEIDYDPLYFWTGKSSIRN